MSFFVDIGNSALAQCIKNDENVCAVAGGDSGVGDDANATAVHAICFFLVFFLFFLSCSSNFILHKVNHIKIRVNLMISVSNTFALTLN